MWISWVPFTTLHARQRFQLRWLILIGLANLTFQYLLLAVVPNTSAFTTKEVFRSYITFTFRFWLACFTVYASPLSLPSTAQDSLRGDVGYTFHDRTFTCKLQTAFPNALEESPEVAGFHW